MPFFRAAEKLVYYAHVPKCGGTSVANYITERFGALAFHDTGYLNLPEAQRWTKSSPQHVDTAALDRLLPLTLFDAVFTVVRHPVARLVSIYHFQSEVEKSVPAMMGFSDWLEHLNPNPTSTPFAYDNHIRPMSAIVPEGATVFHMEHGMDALIGWFDLLEGRVRAPRALSAENRKGAFVKTSAARAEPTKSDAERIRTLYSADFIRFGYVIDHPRPAAPAPLLRADFLLERDKALAAAQRPFAVLRRKIKKKMGLL